MVARPAHNPQAVGVDSPRAAEFDALRIDGRSKYPIRRTEVIKLRDRVPIVTGGGTGIGKAISLAFADEGAAVVVAAHNVARLEEVASQINAKGGKAKAIQTDIADYEQVKRMVAETVEEFGKLDILINNAAAHSYNNADVPDMDLNAWQHTMEVTVTGTMLCAREVMKVMIPRQSGVIVNVGSVAGISGHPTESPYCVSKWAIISFTEVLAIEAGKHNIRVNTISPGATRTPEFEEMIGALAKRRGMFEEEMWSKLKAANSLNRIAEPEEIARAVVFMASDDSSAMTGHNMIVSSGFHLIYPQELHRQQERKVLGNGGERLGEKPGQETPVRSVRRQDKGPAVSHDDADE